MAVALFLLSCQKDDAGLKFNNGEYVITITGPYELKLVGKNVTTSWSENDGWIYLGADENNEPLGTLTMEISIPSSKSEPIKVVSAIQSKTDVRVGTADVLNARSYKIMDPTEDFPNVVAEITDWEIGTNYIKGSLHIDMERVLNYSTDLPEYVTVTGSFTAVN